VDDAKEVLTMSASMTIETPLGRYRLVAGERGLTRVRPEQAAGLCPADADAPTPAARRLLERARSAFEHYFAGRCASLDQLELDPEGTAFQRAVWHALREIPAGSTACYGEIARRVGRPGAARAVGAANHHNPIAIAIPCHRVIGRDGTLTGYAGGLHRKRWLLGHEGALLDV
jgi:methylated-DNA-[protein]-cysteine S-methyltransferase